MTVSTTENRNSYAGNGVTTAFSFPYYFSANVDLVVVLTTTVGALVTKTLTTHYTVTGAGDANGGTVTMLVAPAVGESLVIYRDPELTQDADFVDGDALPAATLEGAFDKLTTAVQRASDVANRAIRLSDGDATTGFGLLPSATARASKLLAFDADGAVTVSAPVSQDATSVALQLSTKVPSMTGAGGYVPRVNVAETGLEYRTPTQTLSDIAALPLSGGTLTGNLTMGAGTSIIVEGATDDAYETTLAFTDPTADRTLTFPNATGTVALTSDIPAAATLVPSGTVIYVGMSAAPTGYLKCNGAAVSRTTYADLFTAISTTFGVGDGTTTFNVPELRGEFIRGLDDSRGVDTARALGSAQSSANLAHTHTQIGYSGATGSLQNALTQSDTDGSVTQASSSSGGSESRPRNIALLACIKF